jgi:hypothetical protein
MMSRSFLALAISAMLTGCATEEELRRMDEATCTSYGFERGTVDFSNCLQRESLGRRHGYGHDWVYWGLP